MFKTIKEFFINRAKVQDRKVLEIRKKLDRDKARLWSIRFGSSMYQKHHNSHALWTRKNAHLRRKIDRLQEELDNRNRAVAVYFNESQRLKFAVARIAPWLSASLSDPNVHPGEEYKAACEAVFKVDGVGGAFGEASVAARKLAGLQHD